MTNASIFTVIICKLSYEDESDLINLFKVNKILKIDLHNTVLSFCLAFSLRIKSNGKFLLNA